ncbi:MAG: hypothetical protein OXH22_14070 [Chloroflexi bacterium]|nr:hypothetical protein [Chloroflexota bacterium]
MSIATYFEQKTEELKQKQFDEGRAEGYAVGLAEGYAEARAENRAWNRRRLQAEACGELFDEPFPGDEEPGNPQ